MNLLAPFAKPFVSPSVGRAAQPAVVDSTTKAPVDAAVTTPDAAPAPTAWASNDRLCHLFRFSLKNGRIHPLYLPVLKYRHANGAARAVPDDGRPT